MTLNPTARFVAALVISIVVLKVIQSQQPRLAWAYVGVVLLGMAIWQREGVTLFLQTLTAQLQGGTT